MASRTFAFVVAILLTASAAASAAPSAAERETARRLMDEGRDKTKAGDWPRALDAYQKAHDLMRVPTTGLALAKTHVAMGHLVEARDVALEVTRMPKEPGEPPIFEQSRQKARELEASVKGRIPLLKIVVKGAAVKSASLDGNDVAPSLLGLPMAVNPGRRVVVVKNADGVEQRTEVDVAEKETKDVELTLPAPREVVAATPAKPSSTGPASDERDRGERSGVASALVYGGFGVALVGAGVGTVTGLMAMNKADAVKPQCEAGICDPAAASDLDGAKSMATLSTIGFAVAGVGVTAGVIGLLLPRRAPSATAVWLGPASAGVRGTF